MRFDKQGGKCVVGFDLRDDVCQLSCCVLPQDGAGIPEPVTYAPVPGEESFDIPTALCRAAGAGCWYHGREAAARAADPDGTYIPHLLTLALEDKEVVLEDAPYDPGALLALFINRCLADLQERLPRAGIAAVMFTSRVMDSRTVNVLDNVCRRLDLSCETWYRSYAGAWYDFMLNQDKELREPASALLEYAGEGPLRVGRLFFRLNTTPVVAYQEESEYPGLLSDSDTGRDEEFSRILKSELVGRNFASVYLIGSGFKGGWMRRSATVLCAGGRRAFLGGNLYSKGAAYGAMMKLLHPAILKEYLFLDRSKLRTNVLVQAVVRGQQQLLTLVEAGVNWYEVGGSTDLILDGTGELLLTLKPLTEGPERPFRIRLEGLPVREGRITRIRMEFAMLSEDRLRIRIQDLGFGETFPSSGLKWEQVLTV